MDNPYYTIRLHFNACCDTASKLLSTAWKFRVAVNRVLEAVKQDPDLPASKVVWIKQFKPLAYDVIPNRRYSYGAIYLVYGMWRSARELGIDIQNVELADWLMFQHYGREKDGNVIRVYEDGTVSVTTGGYLQEQSRREDSVEGASVRAGGEESES